MNDAFQDELVAFVESIADRTQGQDFWIEGCPFVYSTEWAWEGHKESYKDLRDEAGWSPQSILNLGAMCNDGEDHKALGQICFALASHFNGLIEFGARLSEYTNDESILSCPAHFQIQGSSVLGPSLMNRWLQHADFAMVK